MSNNTPPHREFVIGNSDYSKRKIQPWDIWKEYKLNPWDADIVKRVLRTKLDPTMTAEQQRILDYEKIKHVCDERIYQLKQERVAPLPGPPMQPPPIAFGFECSFHNINSGKCMHLESVNHTICSYSTCPIGRTE